jgi:copper transport protein
MVLAVATVAVAGWAVPAFAHAQLQSTDPPSGTVLANSPGSVVLHFGEDVEIQFGAVRVFDSASKRVDTGNAYHPNGDGHAVAVNVPPDLGTGGYVVTWRVISADSHPVHGAFTFLIGSGGANAANASRAEAVRLLATGAGSRTVGVLFGLVRFVSFLALFVLVGGAAFLVGVWPEGRTDPRARWLLWAGLMGAIVATALAIALQGPYGGGLPLAKMLSPTVVREVLRTRFGEVYLARLVILILAGAPLVHRLLDPAPLSRRWPAAGVATGAALLLTPGVAGHAAAGSLVALAIPFDLVHVAATAVWVGGLCMLAVAVLVHRGDRDRDRPSLMSTVVPRYSQWALGAVLAIAISGGFAAWRQIGSVSAVTTTTFGRLVLAKSVIFVVLVTVGSKSRRLTHGRLALPFLRSPATSGAAKRPPATVSPRTATDGATQGAPSSVATTTATDGATERAPGTVAPGSAGAPTKKAGTVVPPATAHPDATTTATGSTGPATDAGPRSQGPGAMAAPPRKRATWSARNTAAARPVRRRTKAQRQSDLRKAVLVELLLATAIVALSAILVNAQPARQAQNQPFSAEVHAGPNVLVDVVVDPAKAGPVAIHLYTLSADGAQLDVPEVRATMSLPSAGVTGLTVPLQKGGTGHFLVAGFQVPLKGTWTLSITVRTTEFDEFDATPVKVRMR